MKKIIFFILFATSVNAQTIEFSGGYTKASMDYWAYVSASDIGSEDDIYFRYQYPEPTSSHNYNIAISYFEKEYFSLKTSFGYIYKGGYNSNAGTYPGGGIEWPPEHKYARLDFLSINTLFRLRKQSKGIVPFFEIGPRYDYLIKQNEAFNIVGGNDDPLNLTKSYFGIDIGTGFYYDFDKIRVGTEFLYNHTFTEFRVFNKDELDPNKGRDSAKIYSSSINLTIGYNF